MYNLHADIAVAESLGWTDCTPDGHGLPPDGKTALDRCEIPRYGADFNALIDAIGTIQNLDQRSKLVSITIACLEDFRFKSLKQTIFTILRESYLRTIDKWSYKLPDLEESALCPECRNGKLIYKPVENCSCHLHPPCNACVSNPLTCDNCLFEEPPF